MYVQAWISKYC